MYTEFVSQTVPTSQVPTTRLREPRLRTLRLITTRACPLLCGFCSVNAGPKRTEMMDRIAADRLVRQFESQGGAALTLTGGEPLMYPAIEQVARTAQTLGLDVTLFTMGLDGGDALSDERLAQLVPLVHKWRFSLHGVDGAAHDRITRIRGSFGASVATITRLVEVGASVDATFVARPDALSELLPVAKMCADLGVRELRVVGLVAQGRQAHSPVPLSTKILAAVEVANRLPGVTVRLGNAARAQLGLANACRAFEEELIVSVDGWVSACHVIEPFPSYDERDNVFVTGLLRTLKESPRLAGLRATSVECGGSCRDGCMMERSVRTAVPRPELPPVRRSLLSYTPGEAAPEFALPSPRIPRRVRVAEVAEAVTIGDQ